jgi:hypothetical protein
MGLATKPSEQRHKGSVRVRRAALEVVLLNVINSDG